MKDNIRKKIIKKNNDKISENPDNKIKKTKIMNHMMKYTS